MTAQKHEIILIDGREFGMTSTPLQPYLESLNKPSQFKFTVTSCWRGYVGTWELKGNKLFLIKLKGYRELKPLNEVLEADLTYLFPGKNEVFADWYTGTLRIPDGKMIEYIHMGFASVYERDLYIKFFNGVMIDYRIKTNSQDKVIPHQIKNKKTSSIMTMIEKIKNLIKRHK